MRKRKAKAEKTTSKAKSTGEKETLLSGSNDENGKCYIYYPYEDD